MLINEEHQFRKALTILSEVDTIAVDTETNGLDVVESRLIGISFSTDSEFRGGTSFDFYMPFRHEPPVGLFKPEKNLDLSFLQDLKSLFDQDKTWIMHNMGFDLTMLGHEDLYPVGKVRDTAIMAHLNDENLKRYGLKELGKTYLSDDADEEKIFVQKFLGALSNVEEYTGNGYERIPSELLSPYACKDTRLTWDLFHYLKPLLIEQDLVSNVQLDSVFAEVLMRMKNLGIRLDVKRSKDLAEASQSRIHAIVQELGYDPGKPSQLARRLYGHGPDALGFEPQEYSKRASVEFPQGLPSMSEVILSRIDHPEIDTIMEYRSLVKAYGTWYQGFLQFVDRHDRMHPDFKQTGTVTGRLSCAKPNMQQIPRDVDRTPVKTLFRPTDGYELWEFDYSQVELRLAVVYCDVEPLAKAYTHGEDIHYLTAKNVGAYNNPNLNADQARYVGKQTNFLLAYGGGPGILQRTLWKNGRLELTLKECKAIHRGFHKAYPGFSKVAGKAEQVMLDQGYVKLWSGRRRHLKYSSDARTAFNSIIQGGAFEIIKRSMIELDKREFRIVNQVHDSVWIEVPVGRQDLIEEVCDVMEWPTEYFEFPFPVDAKRIDTEDGAE